MDLGLAGRAYLVTGGTRGLGRATAEALVADGASVTVSGRSEESVTQAVTELGPRAYGVAADNADPGAGPRLVQAALAAHGRLDGALVSVGGPPRTTLLETTDDQWTEWFGTLVVGALAIARACVDAMGEGGAIGLVLSSSVRQPTPGLAVSNALRPALAMAAKTLADEVGPRGIRVVGLAPGRILTERNASFPSTPDEHQRALEAIPLRRMGTPEEFGRVAAFLLSPAASYVTGTVVLVDGGMVRSP